METRARQLHRSSIPATGGSGARPPRGGTATQLAARPSDATLTVTKAARLLGVHPNTIRAWSDQGRLRFYRINARGDRRYRLGDLQRFLAAAEQPAPARGRRGRDGRSAARPVPSLGADVIELRTRPTERPTPPADRGRRRGRSDRRPAQGRSPRSSASRDRRRSHRRWRRRSRSSDASSRSTSSAGSPTSSPPTGRCRRSLVAAVDLLHGRAGHDMAAILERSDGRLAGGRGARRGCRRIGWAPERRSLPGRALHGAGSR